MHRFVHRYSVLGAAMVAAGVMCIGPAGCALMPGTGGGGMRDITSEEIEASDAGNLMDLIEEIRPGWLYFHELRDPRDANDDGGPLVMVNHVPTQPLFTLQYITLENVREIRYLTGTYALNRYRVNAPSGVILVISPPLVGPNPETPPDTGRVFWSEEAPPMEPPARRPS
jgi:hypothetical protein